MGISHSALLPRWLSSGTSSLSVDPAQLLIEITSHPGSLGGKPCVRVREESGQWGQTASRVTSSVLVVRGPASQISSSRVPQTCVPPHPGTPRGALNRTRSGAPGAQSVGTLRGSRAQPSGRGGTGCSRSSAGTGSRESARPKSGPGRAAGVARPTTKAAEPPT